MCGVLHVNEFCHVYDTHVFRFGLSVVLVCRYPSPSIHAMPAGTCSCVLALRLYVWYVAF